MATRYRLRVLVSFAVFFIFAALPRDVKACECYGAIVDAANRITQAIQQSSAQESQSASDIGYAETGTIQQELVKIQELLKLMHDTFLAAIQTMEKNLMAEQTERTYEPGSQPETNCGNNEMGGGYQISRQTTVQAGKDIVEKLNERRSRYERPVEYREELNGGDWPKPDEAVGLFGILDSGKTLTMEEARKGEQMIEAMTDLIPPAVLPDAKKDTSAGQNYEMYLNNFTAKQSIYQAVIARHMADRLPTIEGLSGWAAGKWGDMGGQGNPPGLVDGRMSQDALRWLLANMRLASANWHENILPTLPEAGLLRDIASMQATQLELERKQVELLENIALMMALDGADRLESNDRRELVHRYNHAIGAEAK